MQSAHAAQSSYLNLITVYDVLCMSIWFSVAENVNVMQVLTGDVQLQAEPAGCRRLLLNRSPKFYHMKLQFYDIVATRKGYFKTITLGLKLTLPSIGHQPNPNPDHLNPIPNPARYTAEN